MARVPQMGKKRSQAGAHLAKMNKERRGMERAEPPSDDGGDEDYVGRCKTKRRSFRRSSRRSSRRSVDDLPGLGTGCVHA